MIRTAKQLSRSVKREAATLAALAWAAASPGHAERITRRRPWLLGASAGAAYTDNSAALHSYLIKHHPELNVYWVINRASPDVSRAAALGPVLFREDLRTYVYALLAEVHVISHGIHDIPTASSRHSRALKVRLGHGLTALKRTRPRPLHTNQSANEKFDLIPVSSFFEQRIKETWGIPSNRLVVTGLPRFDPLLEKHRARFRLDQPPASCAPRLLYMPTWRDWVGSSAKVHNGIIGFLQHPALLSTLNRYNAHLDLCLHLGMRPQIAASVRQILRGRVKLVEALDPQDALVAADALITDYSSVTWDALFVDKPVAFYQFDLDDYERNRGAYFNLRTELPGPVAYTPSNAVALVEDVLAKISTAQLLLGPAARNWQSTLFPYRDSRNCERVTQAILARIQP